MSILKLYRTTIYVYNIDLNLFNVLFENPEEMCNNPEDRAREARENPEYLHAREKAFYMRMRARSHVYTCPWRMTTGI